MILIDWVLRRCRTQANSTGVNLKILSRVPNRTHGYYNTALPWVDCVSQDELTIKTVLSFGVLIRIDF